MRLLIITQRLDQTDPILGFFHRWVEEFAAHTDQLIVIAQHTGGHHLPANVCVHSLHKELRWSPLRQVLRFWRLIWQLRSQYDVVFVHMIPWWVLLGAPIWKIRRKPMYLWYEHSRQSLKLNIALRFVQKVFSVTGAGIPPALQHKSVLLGHGIDANYYCPDEQKRDRQFILAVGRLTKVKRFDLVLHAFALLPKTYRLRIAGFAVTEADRQTEAALQDQIDALGLRERVVIQPAQGQAMVDLYQRATLLLHACEGGLSKAVLEAMACGCLVSVSTPSVQEILPGDCRATAGTLGQAAKSLLELPQKQQEKLRMILRKTVVEYHDVEGLVSKVIKKIKSQ